MGLHNYGKSTLQQRSLINPARQAAADAAIADASGVAVNNAAEISQGGLGAGFSAGGFDMNAMMEMMAGLQGGKFAGLGNLANTARQAPKIRKFDISGNEIIGPQKRGLDKYYENNPAARASSIANAERGFADRQEGLLQGNNAPPSVYQYQGSGLDQQQLQAPQLPPLQGPQQAPQIDVAGMLERLKQNRLTFQ